jgi:hypothetical protein
MGDQRICDRADGKAGLAGPAQITRCVYKLARQLDSPFQSAIVIPRCSWRRCAKWRIIVKAVRNRHSSPNHRSFLLTSS